MEDQTIKPRKKESKWSLAVGWIILFIIIIGIASIGGERKNLPESNQSETTQSQQETIRIFRYVDSSNGLRLRSEPSLSATILAVLEDGTRVETLKEGEGWTQIKAAEKQGWVVSDYLLTGLQKAVKDERESAPPAIYYINQEVRVGKSIWKLIKTQDKGSVLKASESYEPRAPYYRTSYNKTTDGRFIAIYLDWINFFELSPYDDLIHTGNPAPPLVDDKNREFEPLSDDEIEPWLPTMEEVEKELGLEDAYRVFLFFYEVPKDATGLKVEVKDQTIHSDKKALISLGL